MQFIPLTPQPLSPQLLTRLGSPVFGGEGSQSKSMAVNGPTNLLGRYRVRPISKREVNHMNVPGAES